MREEQPIVYIIDDDASVREGPRRRPAFLRIRHGEFQDMPDNSAVYCLLEHSRT
jgi:FixJ family two-component response regulator